MPPARRQQIGLRMIQTTRLRPASKGNTGGRIDTPRFMDVRTAGKGPAAIGTQTKGRNLLKRMEGANNDPDILDWRFLATIHKKRKGMEQELIENERGKGNSLFTNYDEQSPYHGHKLEYKPYVDTSELKIVKAKKNEVLEEKKKLNIKLNQLEDEAKVLVAKMNAEALDELDKMNE